MTDLDRYVHAATRAHARRSYRTAIERFEAEWGGLLPATTDNVGEQALHPNSFVPLFRRLLRQAGVIDAESFSSHSLRRGFATWANGNGWDVKMLMNYVGWRNAQSALRYIAGNSPFSAVFVHNARSPWPSVKSGIDE